MGVGVQVALQASAIRLAEFHLIAFHVATQPILTHDPDSNVCLSRILKLTYIFMVAANGFGPCTDDTQSGLPGCRGTDSLPTNIAVAALEQKAFLDRHLETTGMTLLHCFCMHHQCCLIKKPLILKLPGLATGLVRMAHAAQSSLFLQRLDKALDVVAAHVVRHQVISLPDSVQHTISKNKQKLEVCAGNMSEEDQQLLLRMFNGNWNERFHEGTHIHHYCEVGCCQSEEDCKRKVAKALKACSGRFFEVPLLYRWKYFEPAVMFTFRNMIFHNLLFYIWSCGMSDKSDDVLHEAATLAAMDEDSADVAPSARQHIRMSKVLAMLGEPDIMASWTGC